MITVIRLETSEEDRAAIRKCMGKRGGRASRKEVQKFVLDAYEAALHGPDSAQMREEADEDDDMPAKTAGQLRRGSLKVKTRKSKR